jgi:hypothetical protein
MGIIAVVAAAFSAYQGNCDDKSKLEFVKDCIRLFYIPAGIMLLIPLVPFYAIYYIYLAIKEEMEKKK